MKKSITYWLFAAFFAALFAAVPASADEVVARISALRGAATIERAGAQMAASYGAELFSKDIIKTSAKAKLQVIFADDTVATIGRNSTFVLSDVRIAGASSKMSLAVPRGSFKMISGKISKLARENFILQANTATIGIRGTIFAGEISAQTSKIACTSGEIWVRIAGVQKVVPAGRQVDFSPRGLGAVSLLQVEEFSLLEKRSKTSDSEASSAGSNGGDGSGDGGSGEKAATGGAETGDKPAGSGEKAATGVAETGDKPAGENGAGGGGEIAVEGDLAADLAADLDAALSEDKGAAQAGEASAVAAISAQKSKEAAAAQSAAKEAIKEIAQAGEASADALDSLAALVGKNPDALRSALGDELGKSPVAKSAPSEPTPPEEESAPAKSKQPVAQDVADIDEFIGSSSDDSAPADEPAGGIPPASNGILAAPVNYPLDRSGLLAALGLGSNTLGAALPREQAHYFQGKNTPAALKIELNKSSFDYYGPAQYFEQQLSLPANVSYAPGSLLAKFPANYASALSLSNITKNVTATAAKQGMVLNEAGALGAQLAAVGMGSDGAQIKVAADALKINAAMSPSDAGFFASAQDKFAHAAHKLLGFSNPIKTSEFDYSRADVDEKNRYYIVEKGEDSKTFEGYAVTKDGFWIFDEIPASITTPSWFISNSGVMYQRPVLITLKNLFVDLKLDKQEPPINLPGSTYWAYGCKYIDDVINTAGSQGPGLRGVDILRRHYYTSDTGVAMVDLLRGKVSFYDFATGVRSLYIEGSTMVSQSNDFVPLEPLRSPNVTASGIPQAAINISYDANSIKATPNSGAPVTMEANDEADWYEVNAFSGFFERFLLANALAQELPTYDDVHLDKSLSGTPLDTKTTERYFASIQDKYALSAMKLDMNANKVDFISDFGWYKGDRKMLRYQLDESTHSIATPKAEIARENITVQKEVGKLRAEGAAIKAYVRATDEAAAAFVRAKDARAIMGDYAMKASDKNTFDAKVKQFQTSK